jgi:YhcH/YjgK/YiaL family protein
MIADIFENYKLYSSIHKDWDKAFAVITDWLSKPIPEGANVSLEDKGLKLVMQTYKTVPEESKKFEGHKKNIDIQFMVKGKEIIYWANNKNLEIVVPYSEERDHMSFGNTDGASPIHLVPNSFAVFFPGDGHKTQCQWGESVDAIKIIAKLAI